MIRALLPLYALGGLVVLLFWRPRLALLIIVIPLIGAAVLWALNDVVNGPPHGPASPARLAELRQAREALQRAEFRQWQDGFCPDHPTYQRCATWPGD
jgi:hypothetical protein